MHMNLDRRTGYVKVGSEGCALGLGQIGWAKTTICS
jgi:hypothetical protein